MSNEEIIVNDTENIKETENETILPNYMVSESFKKGSGCSIFYLNLEQLIFEKMIILFEKLQPAQNNLENAKIDLQDEKDKLLMKTDWKKELNESRPTVAMKEAWMKPKLENYMDIVELYNTEVIFYKNKLSIINDLIKHKRLLLQVEGGLKE